MAQQQMMKLSGCSLGPGAPGSGAIYCGADTGGMIVEAPAGTTATFEALVSADFQGGGAVESSQFGVRTSYNGILRMPVGCVVLSEVSVNLPAVGTVVTPPSSAAGGIAAGSSNYRIIGVGSDGLDWTGGIGITGTVTGAEVAFTNAAAGSGNVLNMVDRAIAGNLSLPYPYMTLGTYETARFRFISGFNIWTLVAFEGNYSFGSGSSRGGSRITTTANATPTPIYNFIKGVTNTPGLAFTCDVSAMIVGSNGATAACWFGVKAYWDAANTLQFSSKGTATGTNAGAPPAGWDLSFTTGGSFNSLNGIGVAATNIRWRVNNLQIAAPPGI